MGKSLAIASVCCAAVLAMGLAACGGSAGGPKETGAPQGSGGGTVESSSTVEGGGTVEIVGGTTDEMFNEDVIDAELYVFQIDGAVRTADTCDTVGVSSGGELRDGGFYKVVADVTLLNGGIAGYVNYPDIKQVKSCTEVSPYEIGLPSIEETPYGLVLIGDYADGDVFLNTFGIMGVWKDGSWVYRYDDVIELPDGRRACVRDGVGEADVLAGIDNAVLSCGDYFVMPPQGAA